jgi:succinoglycan biosynthesis protein ExoM
MTVTRIDICICTFKRQHVRDTLQSVAALDLGPDLAVRVVVADNDDTDSARSVVAAAARDTGLDIAYVHAPARNISIARNACLDAVTAEYFAFIDDDEIVTRGWLRALLQKMTPDAVAVMGPVSAQYAPGAPAWMKRGAFHDNNPVFENGKIATGGSCNVLLRAAATAGLRFRADLGITGGEDTFFFSTLAKRGAIAYAPDALVTEVVPANRASLQWLLKRRFRYGQTHGALAREQGQPRVKVMALAALKCGFCAVMAVANGLRPHRAAFWALRGALHMGVVAGLCGAKTLAVYGRQETA